MIMNVNVMQGYLTDQIGLLQNESHEVMRKSFMTAKTKQQQ